MAQPSVGTPDPSPPAQAPSGAGASPADEAPERGDRETGDKETGDRETADEPTGGDSLDEEELVARMKAVPAELTPTLMPELLGETDPRDFPAASLIGGVPVEIVREHHSTTGVLLRIATVRVEASNTHPLLHGPEWIYHPSGGLRTTTWWRDDVKHGPITRYRPVGTVNFEARFEDGQLEGLRREYTKNEVLVKKALYRRGVLHGATRTWYPSGQLSEEALYVDGELDGHRRRWAPSGILILDERYELGRRTGRFTEYHEVSGLPRLFGDFEAGKRTGRWSQTDESGELLKSAEYVDGQRHGLVQLWDPGTKNIVETSHYLGGVQSGPATTWYSDGSPQSEGEYLGGLRTGPWNYWRADGTLNDSWSGVYKDDVRVGPLPGDEPGDGAETSVPDGR